MALRDILTPCARHAARSRPAGPPTSVGQQPGPIPRFAGVARRRKRRRGGLTTVSLRSFPPNGSAPRQESTPHPPRNFSFSVLKLTDCDNQRGLNQAPSPNCPTSGAELYCRTRKKPQNQLRFAMKLVNLLLGAKSSKQKLAFFLEPVEPVNLLANFQ